MWTSIERGFDGVVGRMLSWLTHPPVRPFEDIEEQVEPLSARVTETVSERVEDAAATLRKATRKAAETASRVTEAVAETADEVADAVTETSERISEAAAAEAEEISEEAEEAKDAARRAGASIEADSELDAAVVEPEAGEGDELDNRLLAALAEATNGASMKQLEKATGVKPRQRLKQLIQAGRVERRAVGMKTFYHLAGG